MRRSLEVALISIFTALGVILSPIWFPVFSSKAFPFQHMINILSAVILGPFHAALIAFLIGVIRNSLGIGTIYAFPGGIPGGLVVGFFYRVLKGRLNRSKAWKLASITEPLGTVLIGATVSFLMVAPLIGDERVLALASENLFTGLLLFSIGWFLSSIIGVIAAFTVLYFLEVSGYIKYVEE